MKLNTRVRSELDLTEITGGMSGEEIGEAIKNGRVVKSISALELLSGVVSDDTAYLSSGGRSGLFYWDSSDLSTEVAADTLQGVYVAPSGEDGSSGAWVRRLSGYVTPEMFGAAYDTPNQQSILQSVIDVAIVAGVRVDWSLRYGSAWEISGPLYVRSGSSWFGSGEIKNTNPAGDINSTTIMPGGFNPVYFGPTNPAVTGYTYYNLNAVGEDRIVTTTTPGDAANFPAGTLVWVTATDTWRGTSGDYPVFAHLSIVESSDPGTGDIVLDSTIVEDINTKYGSARIANAQEFGVTDLIGNQLEFCVGSSIDGISLRSDFGSVMARGGMYKCDFRFKEITGKNIVFANSFVRTTVEVEDVFVSRKLCDIAGFSHDFFIDIRSATYRFVNGVSDDISFCRTGECSRDGFVQVSTCNANGFTFGEAIGQIDSGCHRVTMNLPDVAASGHTGAPFKLNQSVVASGTQIKLEQCEMNVNARLGQNCSRGGWLEAPAGTSNMLRCGFGSLVLHNDATFSTGYALELDGEDSYCNSARCDSGVVRLPTGVTGAVVRGYFENGASVVEGDNDVLISSKQGVDLLAGVSSSTNVQNITSTTANNVISSTMFPSNSLSGGDRFKISIRGEIVGINDAKTISFADDNTTFFTFSLAAGDSGNFTAEIEVIVQNSTRYTAFGVFNLLGVQTISDSVDSSEDLSQDSTFNLMAWVANSSDIIRIHSLDRRVSKRHHSLN